MRVIAAIACCLCAYAAEAPVQRGADLAGRIERVRRNANFRASGRLVNVDGSGQREAFQIAVQTSAGAKATNVVYRVTDPAPARVKIVIAAPHAGPATVSVATGDGAALNDVPFTRWRDAILASNITYEDLLEDHYRWRRQTLLRQEKYGARQCAVLKSEPGPADRSQYSSITSWIDETILHPVKVEKVARDGAVKEFLYYGLRKSGGLWSASQIEVRAKDRPGSTFLIITRGAAGKPGDKR